MGLGPTVWGVGPYTRCPKGVGLHTGEAWVPPVINSGARRHLSQAQNGPFKKHHSGHGGATADVRVWSLLLGLGQAGAIRTLLCFCSQSVLVAPGSKKKEFHKTKCMCCLFLFFSPACPTSQVSIIPPVVTYFWLNKSVVLKKWIRGVCGGGGGTLSRRPAGLKVKDLGGLKQTNE